MASTSTEQHPDRFYTQPYEKDIDFAIRELIKAQHAYTYGLGPLIRLNRENEVIKHVSEALNRLREVEDRMLHG